MSDFLSMLSLPFLLTFLVKFGALDEKPKDLLDNYHQEAKQAYRAGNYEKSQ